MYLAIWAFAIYWATRLIADPSILERLPVAADLLEAALVGVLGLGAAGLLVKALNWLLKRVIPTKITTHFVDVVRYLDTSPRSYDVRIKIRKGMVDLLHELHIAKDDHGNPKYDRVVIAAHSLGAYIAYDAITYYWTRRNQEFVDGLSEKHFEALEEAAQPLIGHYEDRSLTDKIVAWVKNWLGLDRTDPALVAKFQKEQNALWQKLRKAGNPWLVTDFISIGTPMYMADKILTRTLNQFHDRVRLRHLATCPPQGDLGKKSIPKSDRPSYSYEHEGKHVLYHAAPFAVTRWTNIWFPPWLGFFGDWFAGPLARLYGKGIKEVPVILGSFRQFIPAYAHATYFDFPDEKPKWPFGLFGKRKKPVRITAALREAVDLRFFLDVQEEEARLEAQRAVDKSIET